MTRATPFTDRYIHQPTLLNKHQKTLAWFSSAILWKRELVFFQKLVDQYALQFLTTEDKKKIDHFQSIIVHSKCKLIDALGSHEKKLAEMLEARNETKTKYFKEHEGLMNDLATLSTQFIQNKEVLFSFIEKAM